MQVYTVTDENSKKGRSFSFDMTAFIKSSLIPDGSSTTRPTWAVLGLPESVANAIRANLLTGRRFETAGRSPTRFEFLKSQKWAWESQRHAEGVLATIYAPQHLAPDPGFVDPESVSALVVADHGWVGQWQAERKPEDVHRTRQLIEAVEALPDGPRLRNWYGPSNLTLDVLLDVAPLVTAYLDRRTRVPLIQDLPYQVLLLSLLSGQGSLRVPSSSGLDDVGIYGAFECSLSQGTFERTAAEAAALYYRRYDG